MQSWTISFSVEDGKVVPFALEKGLWTVVATLAILKTGAAFLPLGPAHPEARLRGVFGMQLGYGRL